MKKSIVIFLGAILMVGLVVVRAEMISEHQNEVTVSADGYYDNNTDNEVMPAYICEHCEGWYYTYCCGEEEVRTTSTHSYGLLWSQTCEVDYCYSRGYAWCAMCNIYMDFFDCQFHYCVQRHKQCSKGDVIACQMERKGELWSNIPHP